jgi:hypothetical protein
MHISVRSAIVIPFALSLLFSLQSAYAAHSCALQGNYGYVYNGTSFTPTTDVTLAETGSFTFGNNGSVSGTGTLIFQFANFSGTGPLWLSMREVQSAGTLTPDADNPCTGSVSFLATATVLQSSNPTIVPVGTVLFANSPRSLAYSISGAGGQIIDIVATSPGTVASGTAHRTAK